MAAGKFKNGKRSATQSSTTQLNINVPIELARWLDDHCEQTGRTLTTLTRWLFQRYKTEVETKGANERNEI